MAITGAAASSVTAPRMPNVRFTCLLATLRAAGYALFRKPDLIEKVVKDFYTSRRVEEDTQRVMANAA